MLSAAKSRGAGTPPWMSQDQRQQEEDEEKKPLTHQDDRQPAEGAQLAVLLIVSAALLAWPDSRSHFILLSPHCSPNAESCQNGLDIEAGSAAAKAAAATPHDRRLCGMPVQVLAGLSYCAASASMVMLNKFALSAFDFHSITMLLLFQCTFCVVAVQVSGLLGLVKLEVQVFVGTCNNSFRSPLVLPFIRLSFLPLVVPNSRLRMHTGMLCCAHGHSLLCCRAGAGRLLAPGCQRMSSSSA